MRIGFDVTPLCVPQSGVGTYTTSLLDELVQLQDEIIPLSHRPLTHGKAQASNGHLPYFPVNKTIWMQAVLPRRLGRLGLDVCHFTNNVGSILTPCPTVITIHDMTLWLYPEYHGKRRLLSMRPIIPLAARRAAAIVTVSESAKQDIVRILGIPPEKVHVIYEAPAPRFKRIADPDRLAAVRRQHDLPERFVLYVGTIEPRKNLVRLLEAFATLGDKHRDGWSLVLVGQRGWHDEAVFAAAERLALGNAIRFLGYVSPETLIALYNLASVAAFPSIYEGFGLPVVEAMVCGVPVVTSSNGSLGEIAGDAAEIVDPTAVDSIAAGLERLMSDPLRHAELRARGLARSATFSWVEAARRTREVYALAATAPQPRPSPSYT
jgi:glycosyltransferase involved in cell wall biosynthesis